MVGGNESFPLKLDSFCLQYLQYSQLNGEKVTYISDARPLNYFIEKGLKQQHNCSSA